MTPKQALATLRQYAEVGSAALPYGRGGVDKRKRDTLIAEAAEVLAGLIEVHEDLE